MRIAILSILLLASKRICGFAPAPSKARHGVSLMQLSTTPTQAIFTKSPRVVLEELPIVHVYDHCPFCVRVRLALGLKNIKHTINFLANDDIPTPTKLVGKKIAPIFVSSRTCVFVFLFGSQICQCDGPALPYLMNFLCRHCKKRQ